MEIDYIVAKVRQIFNRPSAVDGQGDSAYTS